MYDVIVIGSGPAGLSASFFTSRAQLKTLVVGKQKSSQLWLAKNVRNFFGFPEGIDGSELLKKGIKQAKLCGAEILEAEVVGLKQSKKQFEVKTAKGESFLAKSVIIATGIPIQWAGIKNERELLGKGVHTCPSCDGLLYKNKKLVVIGNSNHAADNALELTSYSKDVTIVSHAPKFNIEKKLLDSLKRLKIKLVNARVSEFSREKQLKLVFENNTSDFFDGVFLACGSASGLSFASKLGIEIKNNLLVVDQNSMTSIPGVFAAGNCMGSCRQIAKNVGDGCNAGISVIRYLQAKELYFDYAKH